MDNRIDPDDNEIQFVKDVEAEKAQLKSSSGNGKVHLLSNSGSGVFVGPLGKSASQKSLGKMDDLTLQKIQHGIQDLKP